MKLRPYGPSTKEGFFSHAPMVIEALCVLGYGAQVETWLNREPVSLLPRPEKLAKVNVAHWREALGQPGRYQDWSDFFRVQIIENGWQGVLDTWAGHLAPGFSTAACHGVIRTAHAARALGHQKTACRVEELADGLASWAALYRELPVEALKPVGDKNVDEALSDITVLPTQQQPGEGFITAGYTALTHATEFSAQVQQVNFSRSVAELTDEIIITFAGLIVEAVTSPFTAIVFTHAVTGAAAVRNLYPYIREETARTLAFRAWEAGCALKVAFGNSTSTRPCDAGSANMASLVARAIRSGDSHAIKLAEACQSVYKEHPEQDILVQALEQAACYLAPDTAL